MTGDTPKANRIHIAVFGRRNAGKSALLNALLDQDLSIVSDTPGTTTDPVEKAYELQPIGPVVLIDTAGIDDEGDLGEKRMAKTRSALKRTDIAILALETPEVTALEQDWISQFKADNKQWLMAITKQDLKSDLTDTQTRIAQLSEQWQVPVVLNSALKKTGIDLLRNALAQLADEVTPSPPIVADLVQPPDVVVLVIPIDKEAPKGRLILPQVQTIRELLDADVPTVTVKERELKFTLDHVLKVKPKLVITDSQAFLKVHADVPDEVYLTSFSVLLARQKGDLSTYIAGTRAINTLKSGDKLLILELCAHRPISEDIGRVKIPRWLEQITGASLDIHIHSGNAPIPNIADYKLIIQCGGCVANRTLIQARIRDAKHAGIPITNYGICIAYLHGILDRAVKVFER